ncbi:hypothetical protein BKA64DRAFT_746775 [Cadophora sp. MPI-SDFR-AT-0126]|nr:hypothetical protein BKA64DRAFT_746775 [Leotiomycetes sp. MPI-SDFR-AT-0126]
MIMSPNRSFLSISSSDLPPRSPTSVYGYLSASAGPVAPPYLSGIEPMDWAPERNHAEYQPEILPALVAAGGSFELPPGYAYFPLPISWALAAKHHQLSQTGGSQEQLLQLQLDLDSWHRHQLAPAVEEDKLFLENRFRAAVRNEKPLAEVTDILRQQERVQLAFAGHPLLLQQVVQRQQQKESIQYHHQQPIPRQATDQRRLIQERVAALRQKEADRLAASTSPTSPPSISIQATAQPDFGAALRAAVSGASSCSASPSFGTSLGSSFTSSPTVFSSAASLNSLTSSSTQSPAPAPSMTRPRKFGALASQVNLVVR